MIFRLQEWITRFIAIMVSAFPLLVLGVLAFAILEYVVPRDRVLRLLPQQQWLAIPIAAVLGIVIPVCDCGVVPAARSLLRREQGIAPAIAFLIGAPVINPIVFFTTAAGFGFNYTIAFARLILTFITAMSVATLVHLAFANTPIELLIQDHIDRHTEHGHSHDHNHPHVYVKTGSHLLSAATTSPLGIITGIVAAAGDELLDLGRYLVVGALIAAAVQTFVPQAPLFSISQHVILSTFALMALSAILSVCSISDAPIAASFLGTFAPGAVFAFMLFGQIIDLKNGAMLLATFKRHVVLFFVLGSAAIVLLLSTLINTGLL